MNLVIYTYNFLPQADAEAFCATRFASAIAKAGHKVTVVTMDWPMQVTENTMAALVDYRINIIKIPFAEKPASKLLMARYRLGWPQFAKDLSSSIKVLRKVLDENDKPILMTRAHPLISIVVGWYSRKHASKWISHLSDPIPWFGLTADTFAGRIKDRWIRGWLKKSFRDADATSLTCNLVSRYFHEEYGKDFGHCKWFLTTHIGDFALSEGPNDNTTKNHDGKILLHPGTTHFDRGVKEVLEAMEKLRKDGKEIKYQQVGYIDKEVRDYMDTFSFVDYYDTVSAEENAQLCKEADAVFVPDTHRPTTYSPFLLSKFVYQIYSDKPIVLYAMKESPMYEYYSKFPNSGIFWAETDDINSLANAINDAVNTDTNSFDRTDIRKEFDWETIAREFEKNIQEL